VECVSSPDFARADAWKIEAIERELARLKGALLDILEIPAGSSSDAASPDNRAMPLKPQIGEDISLQSGRPTFPDPELLQKIISNRRKRREYFGNALVSDPAWDMILDLAVARSRFRRVSVSSLCIASGVAPTTALRWIKVLTDEGLILREADSQDKRRTFVSLTEKGIRKVAGYFASLEAPNRAILFG
jgi:DNA-binding MarR family transcriptional regulator